MLCVAYYISHVQSLYAHPHIDGHVQWTIPSVLRINIYTFMQIKYEVSQLQTMVCASLLFLPSVVCLLLLNISLHMSTGVRVHHPSPLPHAGPWGLMVIN